MTMFPQVRRQIGGLAMLESGHKLTNPNRVTWQSAAGVLTDWIGVDL